MKFRGCIRRGSSISWAWLTWRSLSSRRGCRTRSCSTGTSRWGSIIFWERPGICSTTAVWPGRADRRWTCSSFLSGRAGRSTSPPRGSMSPLRLIFSGRISQEKETCFLSWINGWGRALRRLFWSCREWRRRGWSSVRSERWHWVWWKGTFREGLRDLGRSIAIWLGWRWWESCWSTRDAPALWSSLLSSLTQGCACRSWRWECWCRSVSYQGYWFLHGIWCFTNLAKANCRNRGRSMLVLVINFYRCQLRRKVHRDCPLSSVHIKTRISIFSPEMSHWRFLIGSICWFCWSKQKDLGPNFNNPIFTLE